MPLRLNDYGLHSAIQILHICHMWHVSTVTFLSGFNLKFQEHFKLRHRAT